LIYPAVMGISFYAIGMAVPLLGDPTTAREMQAHFVAIAHNLLLRRQDWQQQPGVENTAEIQRRLKRREQPKSDLKKTGRTRPIICTRQPRFTPAAFKLIRWLRGHGHPPTSRQPGSTCAPAMPNFAPQNPTPMLFSCF
jgi:hypothetical protein